MAPRVAALAALLAAALAPRAADAFGPTSLVVLSVNDNTNAASGVTLTEFDYTNGNVVDTYAVTNTAMNAGLPEPAFVGQLSLCGD